jgi:hypothetical protein
VVVSRSSGSNCGCNNCACSTSTSVTRTRTRGVGDCCAPVLGRWRNRTVVRERSCATCN